MRRVLAREEIYQQFDPNMIPDLFVTNNDGYRVSWQTVLGGIPKALIEPNKQPGAATIAPSIPRL